MLGDAAERDVHRFIEELERRLSLQEKAAKEKQKETEPSRGDIFQNAMMETGKFNSGAQTLFAGVSV